MEQLIQKARETAVTRVEGYLETNKKMIYPVIGVKLDHTPRYDLDIVENAVIISQDEKTGNIHLYFLISDREYKRVIEEMFDVKIDIYVGHVVIDSEEKSKKYFSLIKEKFNRDTINQEKHRIYSVQKMNTMKFSEWNNI